MIVKKGGAGACTQLQIDFSVQNLFSAKCQWISTKHLLHVSISTAYSSLGGKRVLLKVDIKGLSISFYAVSRCECRASKWSQKYCKFKIFPIFNVKFEPNKYFGEVTLYFCDNSDALASFESFKLQGESIARFWDSRPQTRNAMRVNI